MATWLRNHPGIEIVSRDRASAYAEAARQGAPQARQVADRWHLLQNLTEAVQGVVERHCPHLREIVQQAAEENANSPEPPEHTSTRAVPPSAVEQLRQARQERRQARCAEMLRLQEQGASLRTIADQLRMHRRFVRQYLRLGAVLPRTPYPRRPCELDTYADYIAQRWQEGCHNSAQLWRELRERGFRGSSTRLRQWMVQYYRPEKKRRPLRRTSPVPSPRQVTWTLLAGPRPVDEQTKEWIDCFRQQVPEIDHATQLATEFAALLREQRMDVLPGWMERAGRSSLASFVAGLRRDWAAVQAAFALPWSQGQVEGQVNRLKMLKRQMYGRAGFPLLRSRMLFTASPPRAVLSKAA